MPLYTCDRASRLKWILTGYWEPLPGFETFSVILRNMPVSFKYFKQFSTQILSQVSVSLRLSQARSTSSKCCSACRTPWDRLAFLRFLFSSTSSQHGSVPSASSRLSCSSVHLTVARRNGCVSHRRAPPGSG